MMSGVPLETRRAFNERWNDKFCYKVASCWLFLLNHKYYYLILNYCDRLRRPVCQELCKLTGEYSVLVPELGKLFVNQGHVLTYVSIEA